MTDLATLIEARSAAMAIYDACSDEDWDRRGLEIDAALNATRDSLLDHRPTSLEEVRIKAIFMASDKAFIEWDDVDPAKLIEALAPREAVA